jgi:hypothetical protein
MRQVDPLAAAARAFALMDHLQAIAVDTSGESAATWLPHGIHVASTALYNAGEKSALGTLLCGLEALGDPDIRDHWPLSGSDADPGLSVVEGTG